MARNRQKDASSAATTVRTPRERIAAVLRSRFALRIHTSVLLLWTFSAGLLTTKAMLLLGVQSMFLRYTVALAVAYAAFLAGVRIWLWYVGAHEVRADPRFGGTRKADGKSNGSLDLPDFSSGGGSPAEVFRGGGGSSGGGGATSSFDAGGAPQPNLMIMETPPVTGGGGIGSGGGGGGDGGTLSKLGDIGGIGDLSGDDGCLIAFAVMIVVGLIALAIGGAFFVISMGPEVLIDAAFSAMLSGGLIRSGARVSDPDWIGSVIKGTWKPFAIVLVMIWIFTGTAAVLTPKAHTFGEVMQIVWPLLLEAL